MERGGSAVLDTVRVAAGLGVVLVGAAAFSVATGPGPSVTYAGRSDGAAVLMLATGAALVLAGLATSLGRRLEPAGDLAVLAGLAWFAATLVGWPGGPQAVRGPAQLVAGFTLPLVLHLVVISGPGRRRPSAALRVAVLVAYAEATVAGLVMALFRDPYFDPTCWANCLVNPFLVHSAPDLVSATQVVDRWFAVATGVLLAGVGVARLTVGSRTTRRRLLPLALPAVPLGLVITARSLAVLTHPIEDPFDDLLFSTFVALAAALILVAAGLLAATSLRESRRRALARLATDLAAVPASGRLEAALADAVGDPGLQVAYRFPGSGLLVDAHGQRVPEPSEGSGRRMTTLTRQGRAVAVVTHSGTAARLEDQIGPSVRLGLENERLRAEVLAQLEELRESRERVVEAGDGERRRLERDLHDGAQQSLLALSYDLRVASGVTAAEGDTLTETTLRRAAELTQEALQDLRDLARGIFPAGLVEVGLAAALRTYADLAPLPVEVRFADATRSPTSTETVAYFAVVEAVQDAHRRLASRVRVTGEPDAHLLIVVIDDDGEPRGSSLTAVVDRVGALGGTTTLGPTTCRLEIPCE
jgi:signal transduction histidine kinase